MKFKTYTAKEGHLEAIDCALDGVMIAIRLLEPDANGDLLVSPEAIASLLLMSYSVIADTADEIRERETKKEETT